MPPRHGIVRSLRRGRVEENPRSTPSSFSRDWLRPTSRVGWEWATSQNQRCVRPAIARAARRSPPVATTKCAIHLTQDGQTDRTLDAGPVTTGGCSVDAAPALTAPARMPGSSVYSDGSGAAPAFSVPPRAWRRPAHAIRSATAYSGVLRDLRLTPLCPPEDAQRGGWRCANPVPPVHRRAQEARVRRLQGHRHAGLNPTGWARKETWPSSRSLLAPISRGQLTGAAWW